MNTNDYDVEPAVDVPLYPVDAPLPMADYSFLANTEKILYERLWENWGWKAMKFRYTDGDHDDENTNLEPGINKAIDALSRSSRRLEMDEDETEGNRDENDESHEGEVNIGNGIAVMLTKIHHPWATKPSSTQVVLYVAIHATLMIARRKFWLKARELNLDLYRSHFKFSRNEKCQGV